MTSRAEACVVAGVWASKAQASVDLPCSVSWNREDMTSSTPGRGTERAHTLARRALSDTQHGLRPSFLQVSGRVAAVVDGSPDRIRTGATALSGPGWTMCEPPSSPSGPPETSRMRNSTSPPRRGSVSVQPVGPPSGQSGGHVPIASATT
jgi:hypothetical protein